MFGFKKKTRPEDGYTQRFAPASVQRSPLRREGGAPPTVRRPSSPVERPIEPAARQAPSPPVAAQPSLNDAAPQPPAPVGESRSLTEILKSVIAEREREVALALPIQQLLFFHNELQHMASLLKTTPGAGRIVGAQGVLESILDTISEFSDFIVNRFGVTQRSVTEATSQPMEASVAVPWDAFPGEAEREAYLLRLQIDLEAILDELRTIRESLAGNEMLLDLLSQGEAGNAGIVKETMLGIYATLAEILQECIKALSEIPAVEAPEEEAPALPQPAAVARPPAVAAPAQPAPPSPASAPAPPASTSEMFATATVPAGPRTAVPPPAASAPTEGRPAPSAPGQGEATGLDVVPGRGAEAEELPQEPDTTHRSEDEAIRFLQDFFNQNSPEGFLMKSQEHEFERMTRQLLVVVCSGVTFSDTDFATRSRRLRDTFTLRKKLHNTLTLNEFKAYFRQTR